MATEQLKITEARLQDAPAILEIARKTFIETFGPVNTKEDMDVYLAESFTPEKIQSEVADPNSKFFLAWYNKEIVGYVKLRWGNLPDQPANTHAVELERIYILHQYLNKKFGAQLMAFSIDYAKRSGYKTIWLGVWEHNERARKFYERWEFTYYGSHQFVLGNDIQTDVLMKKELN